MSAPIVFAVTGAYVLVAISEAVAKRYGNAVMFGGYALANLGIIYQTMM